MDSNFLMAAVQFKIDIIHEMGHLFGRRVEPILISPVIDELRSIASGESRRSREATQALEIARVINFEATGKFLNESVDDALIRVALERGFSVATNDGRLRKKLDKLGVPTVYLRQKTHLEAKGTIM